MTNSAGPDQKPTDMDLHCFHRQDMVYLGSAGPELKWGLKSACINSLPAAQFNNDHFIKLNSFWQADKIKQLIAFL